MNLDNKEMPYLSKINSNDIESLDSIIFDCDGVLIDISKSYDLAIQKTARYFLEEYTKIQNPIDVTHEIIEKFKATGGFNDEVDLTYAAIITISAAKKLNKDPNNFFDEVIDNANQDGISSVENYLDLVNADISTLKNQLDYPSSREENILYSVFDQLFYGQELYSKLFKKDSNFSEAPLIDNDLVILSNELFMKLKKKFKENIAIVSGRGLESVRYSLEDLTSKFNLDNSAFLEDEPRELAKPNPKPLIRSIVGMRSKFCLYVGDSMEDLIMAIKANESGNKTIFCGIIGTSKSPLQKRKLFEENGAAMILESINQLPKVLNLD